MTNFTKDVIVYPLIKDQWYRSKVKKKKKKLLYPKTDQLIICF